MDLTYFLEHYSEPQILAAGGLLVGIVFGACAQQSRFCLRAATLDLAHGVFAVVAQASLRGILKPGREWVAGWWTTADIGGNDLAAHLSLSSTFTIGFALVWFAAGVFFVLRAKTPFWQAVAACGAGLAIPLAWSFTSSMASQAFDPVQVEGVTFTGPSADTLMLFLSPPGSIFDFDIGLVPGVFLGSFLAALLTRELALQGFEGGRSMARYLTGAALMGFGGMLAGGCAVGAGVTGASIFAVTAWITLTAIWLSAAVTDRIINRPSKASMTSLSSKPEIQPVS